MSEHSLVPYTIPAPLALPAAETPSTPELQVSVRPHYVRLLDAGHLDPAEVVEFIDSKPNYMAWGARRSGAGHLELYVLGVLSNPGTPVPYDVRRLLGRLLPGQDVNETVLVSDVKHTGKSWLAAPRRRKASGSPRTGNRPRKARNVALEPPAPDQR